LHRHALGSVQADHDATARIRYVLAAAKRHRRHTNADLVNGEPLLHRHSLEGADALADLKLTARVIPA
jgi:hypothetical protein